LLRGVAELRVGLDGLLEVIDRLAVLPRFQRIAAAGISIGHRADTIVHRERRLDRRKMEVTHAGRGVLRQQGRGRAGHAQNFGFLGESQLDGRTGRHVHDVGTPGQSGQGKQER